MNENNKISELLYRAKTEENLYNWTEAAKLYEQIAEYCLDKNKMEEAANAYKTLGRNCFLISETVDTKAKFIETLNCVIKAYHKAADLFKQNENKAELLECKAETLFASGIIANSIDDAKNSYTNSSDLFIEASKLFSKSGDQESLSRTLTRAAFSYIYIQPFLGDKMEVDLYLQKGISLGSRALKISIDVGESSYTC